MKFNHKLNNYALINDALMEYKASFRMATLR